MNRFPVTSAPSRSFGTIGILALFGAWTTVGVLFCLQFYLYEPELVGNRPVANLIHIVYFYWIWAALTPMIFRSSRAIVARAARSRSAYLWHAPLLVAAVAVQPALYLLVRLATGRPGGAEVGAAFWNTMERRLFGNVITYGAIVAAYHAFAYYRHTRDREVAAAHLAAHASEVEGMLARARLDALAMQLQPHFLFNALNSISTLALKAEPQAATQAIARLSHLLRASLATSTSHEVTFDEEIRLAQHYLGIEELRFADRLRIDWRVESGLGAARVPALLLQPVIENAVRHAVAKRPEGGAITIVARREADTLAIDVRDDGPGFSDTELADGGIGLANVRGRLRHLYGDDAGIRTGNAPGGGAVIAIHLPWRTRTSADMPPREPAGA